MKYVESPQLELKEQINAEFKKEIIAFANTDGGEIYVGIARDGSITGIADPESEMEKIGNMIRDGIKPDLTAYTSIRGWWKKPDPCVCVQRIEAPLSPDRQGAQAHRRFCPPRSIFRPRHRRGHPSDASGKRWDHF